MFNPQDYEHLSSGARQDQGSVLIVEDDGLLSLMLEDLVREHGAKTIFSCKELSEALAVATHVAVDWAVLDIALHRATVYEVADALADRNVPFFFCTGLAAGEIAPRHRHRPILFKPYGDADFKAALAATLGE